MTTVNTKYAHTKPSVKVQWKHTRQLVDTGKAAMNDMVVKAANEESHSSSQQDCVFDV